MLTATKRTLTAVAVIAAASAPSAASARFELNPPPAAAAGGQAQSSISPSVLLNHPLAASSIHRVRVTGVPHCPLRGPCISPTSVQGQGADVHSVRTTEASSAEAFQWGDAGIGAAGMLGLLSASGAAAIASRRRRPRATAG